MMKRMTYLMLLILLSMASTYVSSAADFNGDGKSDILFHQAATGKNFMILMNGKTPLPGGMGFVKRLAAAWSIVGNERLGRALVSTLAGSVFGFADGTGTAAKFNTPAGAAVDTAGNVYVADAANNRIRKITSAGVVTTLAGSGFQGFANGTGTAASFAWPMGIAVDVTGNAYVADTRNSRIRKIMP